MKQEKCHLKHLQQPQLLNKKTSYSQQNSCYIPNNNNAKNSD